MKQVLFLYLLLLSFASFSQTNGSFTLDWKSKKETGIGDNKIVIPFFSGAAFRFDTTKKNITLLLGLGESNYSNTNSLQVTNVVYEPISISELGDLTLENIPAKLNETLEIASARDKKQAFIALYPIIKEGNSFKRVRSFSYSINNTTSRNNNSSSFQKSSGIQNSVLATGDWYRFYIEKSGIYSISKSFLQSLGFDAGKVDPRRIKIYGNGGRMLPLANNIYYPDDLTENAIVVIGENDGTFDNDDHILFYGEGVDNWNTESQTNSNVFDTKSYYYITISGGDGKRIPTANQPTNNSTLELSTYDDYQYHEIDKINIAHTGRQWYGEAFDIDTEQEFNFNFPNLETTTPIKIQLNAASAAYTATSFKISANEQNIGTLNFNSLGSDPDLKFFSAQLPQNTSFLGSENVKIKLTYINNGVPGSKGYLDYINLVAKRKLLGTGKQFRFQYDLAGSTAGIVNYTIGNAAGIAQIWDITDLYNVSKIENPNLTNFSFKAPLGEIRKYITLVPADYYSPSKENQSKIGNQNLKGTLLKNNQNAFQDIDYVIVTPRFLLSQAENLANFHRNNSNLSVKVIALENIYQEFSSGKQDIAAIRNCIKYIYDNASSPEKKIKYLNLFGDASFDYKNRTRSNNNIVPIYQSLISNTTGEASFASDDFFGLMDPNEGNLTSFAKGIDIAVGRMLVSDNGQAQEMVNKVLDYHNIKSFGNWRNNFVLISDDADKSSDASLQSRQNSLADVIATEKPFFNIDKIFLDSYTQEASSGGSRYPKARTDFFNAFEKGALVFNYLGHGGEDGLASERIWEKADGQNLNNQYKYPLFITITCDFSRFDDPTKPTAGEYVFWNPKGGAISMLTTIRAIGQFNAENFNDNLSRNLLAYGSNQYTTIAETLRISKNDTPSSSSNVILYLGDPALMLAIPKPKINLTKVNDIIISQPIPDLKSLSKIKLTGEITDENNNLLSNYNGELSTAIFDKLITTTTLNNDGFSPPMSFKILGETIFRGNASVKNGQFEFSFIVPRDIRIPVDNGRISFYSKKEGLPENQTGFNNTIKIGGVNENAPQDNISPKVKLYMNDETFVSGGITNSSPFLLAFLEDENGINTASGIGHDIIAILDGDVSNPFVLNDYYQTKLDDYTNGNLRFPLRNLAAGMHTISFTAWDVYNNPITSEIQFIVVGDESLTLSHVLNYPNPFSTYTQFWFSHNRPYEPLEAQVQVMTITGKVVWTKNQIITTEGFLSREITWDGKDDFGDKIGKGVYIYKLTVKSTLTNKKAEKYEKLVIL
ncbi:type IX secretion system sortase PorU [Flavobacterium sp. Fl-318]|uniref:Type IX secretion system sortase PorU n=1 Tax=Flavobacterium cupriresistens TaxID=2893885 RepID=A0ABU4RFX0_9FLAO|nr:MULTISPECIES: type IX secretion system sortase PorU [unclassified Flavobacterium]MDX6190738.1 type IX secretion system sortase PorU [Flavobacterium sp. Fl-318]UFH44088.1 type IX secretion system sortase PorU [Flavobacterium sp. F-323]